MGYPRCLGSIQGHQKPLSRNQQSRRQLISRIIFISFSLSLFLRLSPSSIFSLYISHGTLLLVISIFFLSSSCLPLFLLLIRCFRFVVFPLRPPHSFPPIIIGLTTSFFPHASSFLMRILSFFLFPLAPVSYKKITCKSGKRRLRRVMVAHSFCFPHCS